MNKSSMNKSDKNKIFILDTSAILSGKPIELLDSEICTTINIEREFSRNSRDRNNFLFLKESGLKFFLPQGKSIEIVKKKAKETNDFSRLSKIDIEIIALAYELKLTTNKKVVILSEDYSIQNVANFLKIEFETISDKVITKRFKWKWRCRGCGRYFKEDLNECPICGSETRYVVSTQLDLDK